MSYSRCLQLSWLMAFTLLAGRAQTLNLVTLHAFQGTDGAVPHGSLIIGPNSELYGTTYGGGPHQCVFFSRSPVVRSLS